MKVILAGYNYDMNYGEKLRTPETLSASYARISRSELSIEKIRENACKDIEKTRKSNKTIIFGLGHASVAEHAVFNFDIINISRYATEFVQHHRLASFTEKSQRYVKFKNSFYTPKEIKSNKKLLKEYIIFCNNAFFLYKDIIDKCKKENIQSDKINEDARYVLPLSTYTQFGMTVNGRTLEYMISYLNSQNIYELNFLAKKLYKNAYGLAPSIIKYTKGKDLLTDMKNIPQYKNNKRVELLSYTKNQLKIVLANILFTHFGFDYKKAMKLSSNKKYEKIIYEIFSKMEMWDKPPKEFETIQFNFLITLSASAFAQLKRHRMATILSQGYNYNIEPIIPETIKQIHYEKKFMKIFEKSRKISYKLSEINESLAYYTALNSTQRTVIMQINARELYHFARLRADKHAQWEIREIANEIINIAKKKDKILYLLLSGKDSFKKFSF